MSFTEKHNHIQASDYPTYSVEYVSARNMPAGEVYPVTWVGAYDGKYGRTPYVDIINAGNHIRVRLPKWALQEIEEMSRDADDMAEIKAGRISIEFMPYTSKAGNETTHFLWHETGEKAVDVKNDDLPF